MKVLCINDNGVDQCPKCGACMAVSDFVHFGISYSVYQSKVHPDSWKVLGAENHGCKQPISFTKKRFIPVSDIYETEMFREWQISHYTQRLTDERKLGNTEAVAFLRRELYNLKKGLK